MRRALKRSGEGEEERVPKSHKILMILLFELIFPYALILFFLDMKGEASVPLPLIFWGLNLVKFLFIIFLILTVDIIVVIYGIFLPLAWQKYDPEKPMNSYYQFFLVLCLNVMIVVFGLILEVLAWSYRGHITWVWFLLFGFIGLSHLFYIYLTELPSVYKFSSHGEYSSEIKESKKELNHSLAIVSLLLTLGAFALFFIYLFPVIIS